MQKQIAAMKSQAQTGTNMGTGPVMGGNTGTVNQSKTKTTTKDIKKVQSKGCCGASDGKCAIM